MCESMHTQIHIDAFACGYMLTEMYQLLTAEYI